MEALGHADTVFYFAFWKEIHRANMERSSEELLALHMRMSQTILDADAYAVEPDAAQKDLGVAYFGTYKTALEHQQRRKAAADADTSTTASSSGENRVSLKPRQEAQAEDPWANRPFQQTQNLYWVNPNPSQDPNTPWKVLLNHCMHAKVEPLTSEQWQQPLATMDPWAPRLEGGARCSASYADVVNRRYICEMCHVGYPSKYHVAYFMDDQCHVPCVA